MPPKGSYYILPQEVEKAKVAEYEKKVKAFTKDQLTEEKQTIQSVLDENVMKMKMVDDLLKEIGGSKSKSAPKMLTFTLVYQKENYADKELTKSFKFKDNLRAPAFKARVAGKFFSDITTKKMKSMTIIRATEGDALSVRGRANFKSMFVKDNITIYIRFPDEFQTAYDLIDPKGEKPTIKSNIKEDINDDDEDETDDGDQ